MDKITNGVADDVRPNELKSLDYSHIEILGGGIDAVQLDWNKTKWTTLPYREQITSSSCGGQSSAKALTAFFNGQIMSATPIYRERSNFPDGGMFIQDIGNIIKNKMTCLESDSPSQHMTEEQMNSAPIPTPLSYGISAYYFLPSHDQLDMDLLAQALEKGHSLIVTVRSSNNEYNAIPTVNPESPTFGHYVCVTPKNYILHNGEKSLVIDDSVALHSTYNQTGQRIFTESWIRERCYAIMALIPKIAVSVTPPKYTFTKDLSFGMTDPDVKILQDILKLEGCMATTIPSTGYFGQITKQGVMKLQTKYCTDILLPAHLSVATGYVGTFTKMFLNKKYK